MVFDDDEYDNPGGPNDTEEMKLCNNFQIPTMVLIKDSSSDSKNDVSVFPPINHENLYLSLPSLSSSPSLSSFSSTSSFSPSDSDQSNPETPIKRPATATTAAEVSEWRWWIGVGFEALRLKAFRLASLSFGGNGVVSWKASGIVVVMMIWSLWIRARYRRKVHDLVSVVKTRDEKISKLLNQIAQLNEVLIARHRVLASKVPN